MSRGARLRTLPIDSAVEALGELHRFDWSWTTVDLGAAMKAAGLTLREPVDDMTIPFEHPRLPGVDGYVTTIIGRTTVVDVSVTLAEVGDENDAEFRTGLEELYTDCHDRLANQYGVPEERPGQRGADWSWDDDLLELRDLGITVVLTLAHGPSRRRREGG